MRDYARETENRVAFLRTALRDARAAGFVYGNSGGKDSALVGILCKRACENTVGVIMPCASQRNYGMDKRDAEKIAAQYGIETRAVDLTQARDAVAQAVGESLFCSDAASHGDAESLGGAALANIAPRLRMTALYAVAASEGRLVVGTGNRSEGYMGYFTKWGDGAYDVNPIADLTVSEVYDFLRYLGAPEWMIEKAPSAGLFDGQTDEDEMGVSYRSIDQYLRTGTAAAKDKAIIEKYHAASEHKRRMPLVYGG